jgi:sigma-E factor negative regulatory protein RseC
MDRISHEGVVESKAADMLRIKISQSSACSACKVSQHCNAMESKDKIIEVHDPHAAKKYKEGDTVVVSLPGSMGHKAVVWAFIIPFILLVATIFLMMYITKDEGVAALWGLGILIPYYGLLYLLRDKMSERFVFSIDD